MIPEDIKDRVLRETDIEAVIGATVALKRQGRNLVGLCPFHLEKTPSFSVNPERQFFHCFGCKESGDVITFVQKTQGATFVEALRQLAERLGIEIEDAREKDDQWRKAKERRQRELDVMERAASYFERQLRTAAGADHLAYLRRRGFDDEAARRFRLGYAPGGSRLVEAAASMDIPARSLVAVGLASRRDGEVVPELEDDPSHYRDFFFDRLMFPIEDDRGNVVAFGGRTLSDGGPKYLNSRETELFRKSSTLYGYSLARRAITRERRVVVMEGYTDVIAAHMAGFELAVATLGTALTVEHVRMLRRSVDRVDLVYDGDRAGLDAARRGIDVLVAEGLAARVVILPDGLDPCELLGTPDGAERFAGLLETGLEPIDFLVELAGKTWDVNTVDGKASAIRDCLSYAVLADELHQEILLERIAGLFGVSRGSLETAFAQERTEHLRRNRRAESARGGAPGAHPAPAYPPAMVPPARGDEASTSDLEAPPVWDEHPDAPSAEVAPWEGAASRPAARRLETPEEGIVCALLARPDLVPLAEEKLAPSTLRPGRPALADLLELAYDLRDSFTPDTVIELTEDPEVQHLVMRLRGKLDDERAAPHLSECLARLEQAAQAEERARKKSELLQQEREGSAEDQILRLYHDGVRESPPKFVPVSLRRKTR